MSTAGSDQTAYNTAPSGSVQANFNAAASSLEALINRRTGDVKAAMSDYYADGASEEYAAKEHRWTSAADSVKDIIHLLRSSLQSTDEIATHAGAQAKNAVEEI